MNNSDSGLKISKKSFFSSVAIGVVICVLGQLFLEPLSYLLGSTETTFYTISVYFGAAGIRNTRYTIPAALIADLTGFWVASISARIFF